MWWLVSEQTQIANKKNNAKKQNTGEAGGDCCFGEWLQGVGLAAYLMIISATVLPPGIIGITCSV